MQGTSKKMFRVCINIASNISCADLKVKTINVLGEFLFDATPVETLLKVCH